MDYEQEERLICALESISTRLQWLGVGTETQPGAVESVAKALYAIAEALETIAICMPDKENT